MMRTRSFTLLAGGSLLFALASLLFALSPGESTAAPVYKVTLPGISGDDSSGLTYATPGANPTASGTPLVGQCAGPRSAVRTLSDPAAGFGREPAASSLGSLTSAPKPASSGESRLGPLEAGVVRIEAYLVGSRSSPGNGVELLLASAPGDFAVVAGMPSGNCTNKASDADNAAMAKARIDFLTSCGSASGTRPATRVVVEGVPHWTAGNGGAQISLWPLLSFKLADGWNCQGQPPSPTPSPTPVPPITTLILSVDPAGVPAGGMVKLTAQAVPAGPGHRCTPTFFDENLASYSPHGASAKDTDAEGIVTWDITIPLEAAPGLGKFMVNCDGQGGNAVKIAIG